LKGLLGGKNFHRKQEKSGSFSNQLAIELNLSRYQHVWGKERHIETNDK